MSKTIGEKIKNLREESNLSQSELASKISFTKSAISKWEANKAEPDLITIKQLSKIFNVHIETLIDADQDISKASHNDTTNKVSGFSARFVQWLIFGIGIDGAVIGTLIGFFFGFGIAGLALLLGGGGWTYVISDSINGTSSSLYTLRTFFMLLISPIGGLILLLIPLLSLNLFTRYIKISLKFFWGLKLKNKNWLIKFNSFINKSVVKISKIRAVQLIVMSLTSISIILFIILAIQITNSGAHWNEIFNNDINK